jgi:hypothetical protein
LYFIIVLCLIMIEELVPQNPTPATALLNKKNDHSYLNYKIILDFILNIYRFIFISLSCRRLSILGSVCSPIWMLDCIL